MYEIAGLLQIGGVGNVVNVHATGAGRGKEFYERLQREGMRSALELRAHDKTIIHIGRRR
jgi:hypothetical protein